MDTFLPSMLIFWIFSFNKCVYFYWCINELYIIIYYKTKTAVLDVHIFVVCNSDISRSLHLLILSAQQGEDVFCVVVVLNIVAGKCCFVFRLQCPCLASLCWKSLLPRGIARVREGSLCAGSWKLKQASACCSNTQLASTQLSDCWILWVVLSVGTITRFYQ